ncbi:MULTISPECIES: RNA polymerase sigma factor [unclassified Paraflavitalea]|uniref:RNA polymerase sigma factor n=1 Tax=unclassified Paraflavitalea TaxID=2798305 RepID=UPI003D344CE6
MEQHSIFIELIENHKGILYKIANSYCKEAEDRSDLYQEMVLRLWQGFPTYNPEFKLSTWIYRISLNTAITHYRKDKVRNKHISTIDPILVEPPITAPNFEQSQQYQLLQQFIYELRELDKALLLLYLEDKPYREIADILGISETNVGTKLGRLKNHLKQRFERINAF